MSSSISEPQPPLPLDTAQGRVCRRCGLFKSLDELMPHPECRYGRDQLCRSCFNDANYTRRGYKGPRTKLPLEDDPNPACRTCGIAKPLHQYPTRRDRGGARSGECRQCRNAKRRARGEGRLCNQTPQTRAARQALRLRSRYGVTMEAVQRLYNEQDGRCALCTEPIPPYPSTRTHIDHDHVTKRVRGLLCQRCNKALGYMDESVQKMQRAIAYLEEHHGRT